jgi:hypothetical protein
MSAIIINSVLAFGIGFAVAKLVEEMRKFRRKP